MDYDLGEKAEILDSLVDGFVLRAPNSFDQKIKGNRYFIGDREFSLDEKINEREFFESFPLPKSTLSRYRKRIPLFYERYDRESSSFYLPGRKFLLFSEIIDKRPIGQFSLRFDQTCQLLHLEEEEKDRWAQVVFDGEDLESVRDSGYQKGYVYNRFLTKILPLFYNKLPNLPLNENEDLHDKWLPLQRLVEKYTLHPNLDLEEEILIKIQPFVRKICNRLVRSETAHKEFREENSKSREVQYADREDIVNDANIIILESLKSYDPQRSRISTFLGKVIKSRLRGALRKYGPIKIPCGVASSSKKIIQDAPVGQGIHALCEALEVSTPCRATAAGAIYFGLTGRKSFHEAPLPREASYDDPLESVLRSNAEEIIEHALKTLSETEEEVLRLYYGVGTKENFTLEEVGKKIFGKPSKRESVRQIKERALRKLSHPSRAKILKELL